MSFVSDFITALRGGITEKNARISTLESELEAANALVGESGGQADENAALKKQLADNEALLRAFASETGVEVVETEASDGTPPAPQETEGT